MNDLKVFTNSEFGNIRALEINNEPYFVGKDVAEVLGYSNPRKALIDHVDDEDKGVTKCDTLGGIQDMVVINESGLYSLILSSKLPTAKRFKHWVTSEVLPSIRTNGGYIANQENLTDEELIARALIVAQNKIADRDKRIAELNADNERMKPKEIFADAVSASTNSILVRDLAKILRQNGVNIGEKRFYKWLRNHGYIVKNSTQPTQKAMELGLFETIERSIQRGGNDPLVKLTTKVTGKGQQYFINKLMKDEHFKEDC